MCSASRVRSQTARSGIAESHHLFAGHRHGELAEERSLPVVAIRQHQDLAIVAYLEELLGTPMHRAHDDPGRGDHASSVHNRSSISPALLGCSGPRSSMIVPAGILAGCVEGKTPGARDPTSTRERLMGHQDRALSVVRFRGCDGKRRWLRGAWTYLFAAVMENVRSHAMPRRAESTHRIARRRSAGAAGDTGFV